MQTPKGCKDDASEIGAIVGERQCFGRRRSNHGERKALIAATPIVTQPAPVRSYDELPTSSSKCPSDDANPQDQRAAHRHRGKAKLTVQFWQISCSNCTDQEM